MDTWVRGLGAITLFVEDLGAATAFYQDVFALPIVFQDDVSAVFRFRGTLVNLLDVSSAPDLIAPAGVASPRAGHQMQLTVQVDDVDARCEDLRACGIELLNGPMDRPWGIRTASFRDPGGHIWEIAQDR